MSWLGPHATFILVAYGLTILVVALLIGWVVVDHRLQARRLADLESRGVRRRSAARAEAVPKRTDPEGAR